MCIVSWSIDKTSVVCAPVLQYGGFNCAVSRQQAYATRHILVQRAQLPMLTKWHNSDTVTLADPLDISGILNILLQG